MLIFSISKFGHLPTVTSHVPVTSVELIHLRTTTALSRLNIDSDFTYIKTFVRNASVGESPNFKTHRMTFPNQLINQSVDKHNVSLLCYWDFIRIVSQVAIFAN